MVYIVERDTHPCGSLIRIERIKVWRQVRGASVSIFFPCVQREREGYSLLSNCISTQMREQSFDDALEIPEVRKSVPRVLLEWF